MKSSCPTWSGRGLERRKGVPLPTLVLGEDIRKHNMSLFALTVNAPSIDGDSYGVGRIPTNENREWTGRGTNPSSLTDVSAPTKGT